VRGRNLQRLALRGVAIPVAGLQTADEVDHLADARAGRHLTAGRGADGVHDVVVLGGEQHALEAGGAAQHPEHRVHDGAPALLDLDVQAVARKLVQHLAQPGNANALAAERKGAPVMGEPISRVERRDLLPPQR
jgi:hypothetical protein